MPKNRQPGSLGESKIHSSTAIIMRVFFSQVLLRCNVTQWQAASHRYSVLHTWHVHMFPPDIDADVRDCQFRFSQLDYSGKHSLLRTEPPPPLHQPRLSGFATYLIFLFASPLQKFCCYTFSGGAGSSQLSSVSWLIPGDVCLRWLKNTLMQKASRFHSKTIAC